MNEKIIDNWNKKINSKDDVYMIGDISFGKPNDTISLIKRLNGGVVDTKYPVNWQHYKNCILLTQHNEIKQLNTKIFKIVEL